MTEREPNGESRPPDPLAGTEAELASAEINEAEQSGLLRNSATMAAASVVSRITGVFRNTALAAAIGLTISADAFALGNSLPDIVYVLILGGALNAIFVPQLVRRMHDDADGGKRYTDALLSATGVLLILVTIVAVAAAPWIVNLYVTPAYSQEQVDLAVAFARYCLPQIFFFGIYTMLGQVLNAHNRFAMPMVAPIFNNLVAIATYLSFIVIFGSAAADEGLLDPQQTAWLGIGTTLGIVAQSLVLIPALLRTGYRWRFSTRWRGMGLGKAGKLAGWTIGLVGVTQLGFIVITRLATLANVNAAEAGEPAAGLATYTNAYAVFMIPHGIVTVSIVTAQLPGLSRLLHAGKRERAGREIGHTMRLVMTVVAPVAIALFLAAEPLAALLFNYGATNAAQAQQLGIVISIFMLGLPAFTLYYVLQRGWYAREDTRTPFFFAILMNGVLVGLALAMFPAAAPGGPQVNVLAAAYALASIVTLLVAWPVLSRSYGGIDSRHTIAVFLRLALAAAVAMVAAVLSVAVTGTQFLLGDSKLDALVDLGLTSIVVLIVFVAVTWLLRVPEMREVLGWAGGAISRIRRNKRAQ